MEKDFRKRSRMEGESPRLTELPGPMGEEEEELDYGEGDTTSEEENLREEGEAASEEEEDDEEESSSGHRQQQPHSQHRRQKHSYKPSSSVGEGSLHHRAEREEGEASSDEEQQHQHQGGAGKQRQDRNSAMGQVVNSNLEILEHEYRDRIKQRQVLRHRDDKRIHSPVKPPPRSKFESPSPQIPTDSYTVQQISVHKSASLSGFEEQKEMNRKHIEKQEEVDKKRRRHSKERRSSKTRHQRHHEKPTKSTASIPSVSSTTISSSTSLTASASQPELSLYASISAVNSSESSKIRKKASQLIPKKSSRQRQKSTEYVSASPSPPATARNRSRSPPQDRRSVKPSSISHRSAQKRQSVHLSQQETVEAEEEPSKKGKQETVTEKTKISVTVSSTVTSIAAPSPASLMELRAGRAPIIDGSRFKYDEGFSSSSSSSPEFGDDESRQPGGAADEGKGDQLLEGVHGDEIELTEEPMEPTKPFYYPSIQGCRSVDEFECLNRIEEGTYGVVYRARDKKTSEIVALKRLKMEKERDGFPITSLREINTLMKAQHENIVTVREVVVGSDLDKIYLVMEFVEHDLKALMEVMSGPFTVGQVKCLLVQLLRAVSHLHDNWILHRDLKTSNLLLSHKGILKVGDFGLAREYGSPLKHYTEVVVTLWYRAPELLLGAKKYSCPIDMWSVGCIFAEFLLQRPLFPGKGEVDQLNIIFRDLGTPNERIWPGCTQLPGMKKCVFTEYAYNSLRRRFTEKQISEHGFELLNSFLTYCPERRITAEKALSHPYFNERPREIHPSMFPSWPAKSEGGRAAATNKRVSPKAPPGGNAAGLLRALNSSVSVKEPPPPLGGQRFYATRSPNSRSNTGQTIGNRSSFPGSGGLDLGFQLKF